MPCAGNACSSSTSTTGPGVEATANLLTELCEALAADHDVTVIAGAAPRGPPRGRCGTASRSSASARPRTSARGSRARALNYLTYVVGVIWKGMFARRPDLVVCMTDPPFIGAIARVVAARFRVPLLVIAQDVFPEIAVKLGRLRNPLVDPRAAAARRLVAALGRPRGRDRRHDEAAARGEGRARRSGSA